MEERRMASFSNYPPPEGAHYSLSADVLRILSLLRESEKERKKEKNSEVEGETAVPRTTFVEWVEETEIGCNLGYIGRNYVGQHFHLRLCPLHKRFFLAIT